MKALLSKLVRPAAWVAGALFSLGLFADNGVFAQAVQLPTFNYFTTNTSVLVPDGGSVYMGGVNRATSGRVERGLPGLGGRPFRNVATSRSTSGGGVWVSAQIHDFEAMDRALLGQSGTGVPYGMLREPAVKSEPNFNDSIVAIRSQATSEESAKQQEAAAYLERGRQKAAEGNPGLAKVYFQMALRRATGELKQEALTAIQSIDQPAERVAER